MIPWSTTPPFFVTLNEDRPDFMVPGGDMGKAQHFLDERGVNLRLLPFGASGLKNHEDTRILGLREARYDKEPVYEIYYECCGKPLKIALAKKGSAAAAQMDQTSGDPERDTVGPGYWRVSRGLGGQTSRGGVAQSY